MIESSLDQLVSNIEMMVLNGFKVGIGEKTAKSALCRW